MQNNVAIEVRNLTKYYGDLLAVDHINFQVQLGEIFGFLGPNGAGKTTTIRILIGLAIPSSGFATVNGYHILTQSQQVKQGIGVVPEESILYDDLSARRNLYFIGRMYEVSRPLLKERTNGLLEDFELPRVSPRPIRTFSKGMKRKLTLAAALIHDPETLFLDEPTAGLDVMSSRTLREKIKRLKREGKTIFLTTHNIEEAERLCDRIAIINKGKILTIDTPQRLKSKVKGKEALELQFDHISPSIQEKLNKLCSSGEIIRKEDRYLITSNISQNTRKILAVVEKEKAGLPDIRSILPSLEEAFVKLTSIGAEEMKKEEEGKSG